MKLNVREKISFKESFLEIYLMNRLVDEFSKFFCTEKQIIEKKMEQIFFDSIFYDNFDTEVSSIWRSSFDRSWSIRIRCFSIMTDVGAPSSEPEAAA